MAETYFLPADYKINPANITLDQDGGFYWDPDRVARSRLHQFDVYKWALSLARQHDLQNIVDVGCGFAAKLHWMHEKDPSRSYWGVDQGNAIALCREHYDFGHWHAVDFENSPEPPPVQADLAISSDVIEHLRNPDLLLDYLRRITSPAGYVLISTPERKSLRGTGCRTSPNPYHVREWDSCEFKNYIESRGFRILDHKILPAMRPGLSSLYFKKLIRRGLAFKNMRYNQAVLAKVA